MNDCPSIFCMEKKAFAGNLSMIVYFLFGFILFPLSIQLNRPDQDTCFSFITEKHECDAII